MTRHTILICSLLIALSPVAQAQDKQSILIDTFQKVSCEELWARLDNLQSALGSNPDAVATISLSGKIGELHDDLWIEDMIRGYFLRTRPVSSDRWKIVRTRPEVERNIEFWITPAGAEAPKIETAEWSLAYPRQTKPFMFAYEPDHMEEVTVCLDSNRIRLLAQVLQANSNARTNVVLIVRSRKEFERREHRTLSELVDVYGIRREQIKIFKKITRRPNPYRIHPDVEYWLIP